LYTQTLRKALTGVALLALTSATAVQAQVVGPIANLNGTISHTTEFTGAPSDVLTFPKFDGTLGILLSVAIHLDTGISSVITVTNSADTPSSGTVFTQSQFTMTDPLTLITLNPVDNTPSYPYSLAPGGTVTSGALTGSASADSSSSNALLLAEFTTFSAETIDLPVTTFTQTFTANTGGNTSSGQVTTASASGTITYTYQPLDSVPEPGAWAFLGTSLIGGGFFAIRRRRK
jgi:hypothetical protein